MRTARPGRGATVLTVRESRRGEPGGPRWRAPCKPSLPMRWRHLAVVSGRAWGAALALALGWLLQAAPPAGAAAGETFSARLRWAPVPGATGYRVYFRNGSTGWDAGRDVGPGRRSGDATLEAEVAGLALGNRNIFSVAAYDLRGVEGSRSGERGISRADVLAVVPTPTPDGGGSPTATPVPSPTSTPTPDPTPTPTAEPEATSTPVADSCGDGKVGPTEECDGAAADACPGLCSGECSCLEERDLPLRGWTVAAGDGSFGVFRILDDDGVTPIRVLQTDTGSIPARSFGIAHPPTPTLGIAARTLSVVVQATESFALRAVVRDATGTAWRLTYTTGSFVPTRRGRAADFPLDRAARSPDFVEVKRDLAADLAVATGRLLVSIEQVALFGRMSVKRVRLSRRLDEAVERHPGETIELPSQGWAWNGEGRVDQGLGDPDFDAPTLSAAGEGGAVPVLTFPQEARRRLVAPYGRLTAEVGGSGPFSIELVLELADRSTFRLTYDGETGEERRTDRTATLPMPDAAEVVVPGDLRVRVVDPEADLARLRPDATLAGIARVRLRGSFRTGPILLDRRLDR